jgi:hypothetical protein
MTDSTPFHFPRPGAALIEEARAARQAAQRTEQEEQVGSHPHDALSAEGSHAKASTNGCLIPRTSIMNADTVS